MIETPRIPWSMWHPSCIEMTVRKSMVSRRTVPEVSWLFYSKINLLKNLEKIANATMLTVFDAALFFVCSFLV